MHGVCVRVCCVWMQTTSGRLGDVVAGVRPEKPHEMTREDSPKAVPLKGTRILFGLPPANFFKFYQSFMLSWRGRTPVLHLIHSAYDSTRLNLAVNSAYDQHYYRGP